jgi:hypothetical protein
MLPCWRLGMIAAALLLASSLRAQFAFKPRQHQDMEAVLTVEAGKQTPERGLGNVTLTLTIVGPPILDVEEPRLEDAAAAWKEERLTGTRTIQDQTVTWSQIIRLQQIRRGPEPLPDVTVRFRRGPESEWIEEKWIDILRYIQDGSETPRLAEKRPSWLRRWGFVLLLAATVVLVLLAWLKKRNIRRQAALPLDRWALREIERIETTLLPPQGAAETYHTHISFVVRRYLAERFGLRAFQQTTPEFLEAIRHLPQLPPEEQTLLTELFQRCDLAKFARAGTTPEECQQTAALARDLVRQTIKAP